MGASISKKEDITIIKGTEIDKIEKFQMTFIKGIKYAKSDTNIIQYIKITNSLYNQMKSSGLFDKSVIYYKIKTALGDRESYVKNDIIILKEDGSLDKIISAEEFKKYQIINSKFQVTTSNAASNARAQRNTSTKT